MKKFFKVVGTLFLVCAVALVAYVLYLKGAFDTRFWGNNSSDYQIFQPGTYVCGDSFLSEGDYDVIVKGGVESGGFITIDEIDPSTGKKKTVSSTTVHDGDKGFHFSIKNGQFIEIRVHNPTEMRIKKVG